MNPKLHQRAVATAALALGAVTVLAVPSAAENATPTDLATHTLNFTGEGGGTLGYSASRVACDVNGDGFDDTVIGDPNWDRPNYENVGAGYVLFGSATPSGGQRRRPERQGGPHRRTQYGSSIGHLARLGHELSG